MYMCMCMWMWMCIIQAHINFRNMDQIVDYINNRSAEWAATIRYGTLDSYLDTVHGNGGATHGMPSNLTLPVVNDDFFVMDEQCCQKKPELKLYNCWSGYFSTFPTLKRMLRVLEGQLRHAEMLAMFATQNADGAAPPPAMHGWEAALGWGRHTAGILQHHDAITGTGGPACNVEYVQMLRNSSCLSQQVIANATAVLFGMPQGEGQLQFYQDAVAPPPGSGYVPPPPPPPPPPLPPGTF